MQIFAFIRKAGCWRLNVLANKCVSALFIDLLELPYEEG